MGGNVSSLRSKKRQAKKRKAFAYKIAIVLSLVLLLLVGSAVLSRSEIAQIKNINISGNQIVDRNKIEKIVNDERESKFLWIIPKNNIALYPKKSVKEKILQESKAVLAATVYFADRETLNIEVSEYQPEYLWCDSSARENCYFMNKEGYIFARSAEFSENVIFTFYGLVSGEPAGQYYLPADKFDGVNEFLKNIRILDIEPISLSAWGNDDFEIGLVGGGSIFFSIRGDLDVAFENLDTVVSELRNTDQNFIDKIEYIDVRFGSKAFFKVRSL